MASAMMSRESDAGPPRSPGWDATEAGAAGVSVLSSGLVLGLAAWSSGKGSPCRFLAVSRERRDNIISWLIPKRFHLYSHSKKRKTGAADSSYQRQLPGLQPAASSAPPLMLLGVRISARPSPSAHRFHFHGQSAPAALIFRPVFSHIFKNRSTGAVTGD